MRFLIVEGQCESVGVSGLAVGAVDVEGGANDEAGVLVEALSVGEGELAISVELALEDGVSVELVASANSELGGGGLALVKIEGSIESSKGGVGDFVEVGDSDSVGLEQAEHGEDVAGGGVSSSSVDGGEGATADLALETNRETFISNNSSKAGVGSLSVEDIHRSVEGNVVVFVFSIKLDGIELLGVNNGGQFEALDGLVNGSLKLGVLVGVSSESNSDSVLGEGVFGVDHTNNVIATPCEGDLLGHSIGGLGLELKFALVREILSEQIARFLANISV